MPRVDSVDSIGIISSNFTAIVDKVLAGESFVECLRFLEAKAREANPRVSTGALNNCRGRWFEIILTYLSNYQVRNSDILFLKLGTSSDHSIFDVFHGASGNGASLNLSIPDLIVLKSSASQHLSAWKDTLCSLRTVTEGPTITRHILSGYNILVENPVRFEDCKALCSVKTSLRPDRKYQAMYEAEFVKAFQLKFFPQITSRPKYLMVGPLKTCETKRILETNLSLISLALNGATIGDVPTIDKVCVVNNLAEMNTFIGYCQAL